MAEAREMFLSGQRWWPEGNEVAQCEEAQSDRTSQDAWLDLIQSYVEKERLRWGRRTFVTIGDVLLGAIGLPLIMLAIVLEVAHLLRSRRVGPTRRVLPPPIPVGAG